MKIGLLFLLLFMLPVHGLVDTKNANYTKTFIDISLPGARSSSFDRAYL